MPVEVPAALSFDVWAVVFAEEAGEVMRLQEGHYRSLRCRDKLGLYQNRRL